MNIAQALESYLVSSNLREESTKAKKFYVSDMGKCQRMRYLKRKGIETELQPFVYWTFAMGNMIHDWGYKALESKGLLLAAEEYIDIGEHWSGRFDGKIKTDAKPALFDFKSAGKFKFKRVIGGEDDEITIAQILTYVLFYKKEHKDISDSGYVVYLNKEPNDEVPQIAFEKEYFLTEWRAKKILEEQDQMVNFWIKNKIPPCTCEGWQKGPRYNSFYPLCQSTEAQIKKYLELLQNGKKLITTKSSLITIDANKKRVEIVSL
jgi:hypothetical protein